MDKNELLTKEDLKSFEESIVQRFSDFISTENAKTDKWLRSSDVKKMLNISAGTLQNLRINGTIPYTKMGGTIYYPYEEVINALNSNMVNSNSL